jgi:indolepyruvate ferredoxin oxidoreductase beta subunit
MKTDIILAGVGGQGILSIAAILGAASLNENLYLKQAETHGMSQRVGKWFRTFAFPVNRFFLI